MSDDHKNVHKVHILYLIGELGYGGSERQLYLLLKYLDKARFAAHVLVFNRSEYGMLDEKLRQEGVQVEFLPRTCSGLYARSRYIYRRARQLAPDIIHSWSVHDNAYAGIIGRFAGVPVQLGSLRGSIQLPGFRNLHPLLRWLSLHSVPILTVNASSIAAELRQVGYPGVRIAILPNCVEIPPPLPPPDLREYGISDQQPLIGTVGNLRAVKNQALFIESMAKVSVKFPDVRGVIVGQSVPAEGDLAEQLERRIQALGLQGKVILLGFCPDVTALIGSLSIFCLTSDSEGTPNTVLEAMAASRPVVATRVGGIPDIIHDGVSGMLIDRGDSDALAARLVQLLENPDLGEQIGQVGKRVVERQYSCQDAVNRLADLYQHALARLQPASATSTTEGAN